MKTKRDVGPSKQVQAFPAIAKRKGKFGKFSPQKKKINMSEIQCYGCQTYGHFKRDFPKLKKEKKKMKERIESHEKKKSKEEVKDPYYD